MIKHIKPVINYLIPPVTYLAGKPLQKPTVYLRMSPLCNLRCRMCDEWKPEEHRKRREKGNQLTREEYEHLIRQLADFKIDRIQFGGGEPLLNKNTCYLIQYAGSFGIPTRILTNGYLLHDKKIAEGLAKGIDEVWISLDGPNAETNDRMRGLEGCFDKVIEGIKNLNEIRKSSRRKFKVIVTTNISSMNIFEPQEMIDLLADLDIDFILFTPIYTGYYGQTKLSTCINKEEIPLIEEMIRKTREIIYTSKVPIQTNPISLDLAVHYYRNPEIVKNFRCFLGGYDLAFIETNGDVYPCTAFPEPMGNIREKPFKEIWYSKRARQVRKKIRRLECGGCFHLSTQKNHLYNIPTLFKYRKELFKLFKHLTFTHGLATTRKDIKK